MTHLIGLVWPPWARRERVEPPPQPVEMQCPNDRCSGYDVDQPPDRTPQVLRHRWTSVVPEASECELCGELGEEAE